MRERAGERRLPAGEGAAGFVDAADDGVRRALGRPPRTFAEFAESTAAAGGRPV
ncbi:hypothetical protein AB0D65_05780 [Streptomyces griseoloalbus]|uniref:NmrA family transcriptional regulator n=1 Tax=Streptomyces griseoloalbus TaxID=67303 RepID=A0ABV3E056_9ACTN